MPAASAKPSTSAVLVSGRIRITGSPAVESRRALSDENAARPTAIPPDAPIPVQQGRVRRNQGNLNQSGKIDFGNPIQRFLTRDQFFVHEVDGDAQRGARRPLRGTGLEHPQFAVLDGEFDILNVAKFLFEPAEDIAEFGRKLRQRAGDGLFRVGRPAARNDVFALGVEHKVDHRLSQPG